MFLVFLIICIRFDNFLTWLPGINRHSEKSESLMVDLKVARFFSKPFFHLLGYRERVVDQIESVESELLKFGIPVIRFCNGTNPAKMLNGYFGSGVGTGKRSGI